VITPGQLHEALPVSDFIVVLAPLTPATHEMIGENEFQSMKPTAVVLNFSRGAIIKESALLQALQQRTIRGAGLDVFHQEPLPSDHPLWDMEHVLISPHTSGITVNLVEREMELFQRNYAAFRAGTRLPNQVNLKKRY
jgi:phosphoglycerate dehydrogenase-like enzyme